MEMYKIILKIQNNLNNAQKSGKCDYQQKVKIEKKEVKITRRNNDWEILKYNKKGWKKSRSSTNSKWDKLKKIHSCAHQNETIERQRILKAQREKQFIKYNVLQ